MMTKSGIGSTMSPACTSVAPLARARIFSTAVMPIALFLENFGRVSRRRAARSRSRASRALAQARGSPDYDLPAHSRARGTVLAAEGECYSRPELTRGSFDMQRATPAALLCLAAALLFSSVPAPSAASWKPEKAIEIVAPSGPGGTTDRTARVL